jgi:hypothetical protein
VRDSLYISQLLDTDAARSKSLRLAVLSSAVQLQYVSKILLTVRGCIGTHE